jgi:hypothetical protein
MTFKSILEPSFKYRNAASTDVSKTFERIRREQRQGTSASQNSDARAKVVATIGRAQRSLQSTR